MRLQELTVHYNVECVQILVGVGGLWRVEPGARQTAQYDSDTLEPELP